MAMAAKWRHFRLYLKRVGVVTALFIAPLLGGPLNHHVTSPYVRSNEWRGRSAQKLLFFLHKIVQRALSKNLLEGGNKYDVCGA